MASTRLPFKILQGNPANNSALALLVQADWPHLAKVSLDAGEFAAESAALLCKACWPCLQHLCLWRLRLDRSMLQLFQDNQWPRLKRVFIDTSCLTSDGVACLAAATWPELEYLCIGSGINVGKADVAKKIVCGCWPLLKSLDISGIQLSTRAVALLNQGTWSLLEYLAVTVYKSLQEDMTQVMVSGNWPKLQRLFVLMMYEVEDVMSSHVRADCLSTDYRNLCKLNWPGLTDLTVSCHKVLR